MANFCKTDCFFFINVIVFDWIVLKSLTHDITTGYFLYRTYGELCPHACCAATIDEHVLVFGCKSIHRLQDTDNI